MTKVQDDLTALRVDTMTRLDRHENHLTSIRDDISVAVGRTGHMRRIHDTTREEVRDLGGQLGTTWRKANRLEEVVRGLSDRAGEGEGMSRPLQADAGPDAIEKHTISKTLGTKEKALAR